MKMPILSSSNQAGLGRWSSDSQAGWYLLSAASAHVGTEQQAAAIIAA
jgi:hypothetical protein